MDLKSKLITGCLVVFGFAISLFTYDIIQNWFYAPKPWYQNLEVGWEYLKQNPDFAFLILLIICVGIYEIFSRMKKRFGNKSASSSSFTSTPNKQNVFTGHPGEDSPAPRRFKTTLKLQGKFLRFMVDTGATVSAVPRSWYQDNDLMKVVRQDRKGTRIKGYGADDNVSRPCGINRTELQNPGNGVKVLETIYVMNNEAVPILSCEASSKLGIVTFNLKQCLNPEIL